MNIQGQEAPYFCFYYKLQCYMIVWIRYWRQVQARAVIHSACNASEKSMRYYTRQKGDNNIIYIQPASQLRLQRKKTWQCNILRHKWWTEDYDPECPPGLLDARAFSRGWRAFTTMLMFGRKSASYCTHNAATAANYLKDARKQISISIQWQVWVDKKLMKKIKQHATALISHLNIALCTI